MISAFSCGAAQHCPLAPGFRWQIRNQGAVPECIPLRSWVDPFSCPLPKPPCRPWPRSLALQSHIGQDRTILSPPITVLPQRRVFGARPAWPRPHGPVCPPEPSSIAQLQATLKDKCTAEWVLILKSCGASSMLAQALEASQHPQILVEASAKIFGGYAIAVPPHHPPFPHLCKSVRG